MSIEFRHDPQLSPLIRPIGGDAARLIVQRVRQHLRADPRLFLPYLRAEMSSNLRDGAAFIPSQLVLQNQTVTFDAIGNDLVAVRAVLTLVKRTGKGVRRLRVELCTARWPSMEVIKAHQREPHAALAIDVSWVEPTTLITGLGDVLQSGTYYRVIPGRLHRGALMGTVDWLHNPVHDAVQAQIDAQSLRSRQEHEATT